MISDNILSVRLKTIADMVPENTVLADIGTDHGYIPIVLCASGRIQRAIAADINEGPLDICREHVISEGLEARIDTRLSDGLDAVAPGEADCILIAGIGGDLTVDILTRGSDVIRNAAVLILSPHTHPEKVRRYLFENGFAITDEDMVKDSGKYYPVIKAEYDGRIRESDDLSCLFGPVLISKKHPMLKEYLEKEKHKYDGIIQYLKLVELAGNRIDDPDTV